MQLWTKRNKESIPKQKKISLHVGFFMKKSILFLTVLLSTSVFAQEAQSFLKKLQLNHTHCVQEFTDDKIYIQEDHICFHNETPFIIFNKFEAYLAPILFSNQNGYYLEYGFANTEYYAKSSTKGPCPACNINTTSSGRCQNTACWFHGMKVL